MVTIWILLMNSILFIRFAKQCSRLRLPVLMLCVFLQRNPVLNTIVERQFSLGPHFSHIIKWLTAGGIIVGSVNTVTGATASVQLLKGFDETKGALGEPFEIKFASSSYVVGSYKLGATAPPGLSLGPIEKEFGIGTIEGIPTQVGVYNVDIYAYEEDNLTGDSTLLALTVYVLDKGPQIVEQPQSASLAWGSSLSLDVVVENSESVSYQWQLDGVDLVGANSPNYAITPVTSVNEGLYTVSVTKDGETKVSDPASVSVLASSLELWKEQSFENPFGDETDTSDDPDSDGLTNFFEYSIGSNPEVATSIQLPFVGREISFAGNFVVYTYPRNPNADEVSIQAEYKDSLTDGNWAPIIDMLNGIRVVETTDALVIKVPSDTACFIRFRLSGPTIN